MKDYILDNITYKLMQCRLVVINPFPHTAILQQTTFRKILNVHSAERNKHFVSWKAFQMWSAAAIKVIGVVAFSQVPNTKRNREHVGHKFCLVLEERLYLRRKPCLTITSE